MVTYFVYSSAPTNAVPNEVSCLMSRKNPTSDQRSKALEWIAIPVAGLWLAVVLFLKINGTPRLWDDLFALIRGYQDFHLGHSYSLKIIASAAVALCIVWVVLKCGGHLLGKILTVPDLSSLEKTVFSAGLGFTAVSFVTLVLGFLRLWYVSVYWCVFMVALIAYLPRKWPTAGWHGSIPSLTPLKDRWSQVTFGLILAAGLLFLLGDVTPEIFYDSLHYHLAVPNLYLLNHRIYNLPNFPYASFIMVVQTFWGFALTVGNEITVKLLHGAAALLLFFAFVAFEKRYLSQGAGLLGTLLFVSMPVVGFNVTTAGIDVASSALQFLAVFALTRALVDNHDEAAGRQWIRLAGILMGVAATCKFTSIPTIPIACSIIIWIRRQQRQEWSYVFKQIAVFLLYAGLVMFPFYAKNVVFYGNPVYPLAGTFWGEPRVTEQSWSNIAGETAPPQLWGGSAMLRIVRRFFADPWFITMSGRDGTQNFVGPLLLGLLPLLLVVRPYGVACGVLIRYSLGLWVVWLFTTTAQVRFGMPLLSIISLLLAQAVLELRTGSIARRTILVLCIMGAAWNLYYTFLLTGLKDGWRVVGGMISENDYLKEQHVTYPTPGYEALDWMNKNLPAASKVMIVGDSRSYHTRIAVLPFSLFDTPQIVEAARKTRDGADMSRSLHERGVTHLFVNAAEAERTESYGVFRWDSQSWAVFEDFWRHHVRLIWMSTQGFPGPKALFVYEIRQDMAGSNLPPPENPFERWKPK